MKTAKWMNWQFLLVVILVSLSVFLYCIHYIVYGNSSYIFNTVLARIAFVPIQVLLIAIVSNHLLTYHEKKTRLEKLNMVVEDFFTEVGHFLLAYLSAHGHHQKNPSPG